MSKQEVRLCPSQVTTDQALAFLLGPYIDRQIDLILKGREHRREAFMQTWNEEIAWKGFDHQVAVLEEVLEEVRQKGT